MNVIQDGIIYLIDQEQMNASIIRCKSSNNEIIIPRSIFFESNEYPVISILMHSFEFLYNIKSIQFESDSKIEKIEEKAFFLSSINSITIPASLIELEEGWCSMAPKLTNIKIDSNNPRYSTYKDVLLIGKTSIESENFDVLVFCAWNIESITIPSFIETIGPYAFDSCSNLVEVEILNDSKLRVIERYAFYLSSIQRISFPPSLTEIKKGWCHRTPQLKEIIISSDNPTYSWYENDFIIKKVKKNDVEYHSVVFARKDISIATIPSFVVNIGPFAFDEYLQLKEVKTLSDSKLLTISRNAFFSSSIESITIPSNFVGFKRGWCSNLHFLSNINIMPNNKNFIYLDNKFIIGKSDPILRDFDVLIFARRDIRIAKIPTFIKKIDYFAFDQCTKLKKVEFTSDSNIEYIEKYGFFSISIEKISLPSNLQKIGDFAFSFNDKFHKNEFDEKSNLKSIGKNALANTSIESILIPPLVTEIGDFAFSCCNALQIIEISENSEIDYIDPIIFDSCGLLLMVPNLLLDHLQIINFISLDS